MAPKTEEKILEKLNKIENLLMQITPQKTELTEGEVLGIVKEGDRELREGKTEDLEVFLKREYPQYVKKNRPLHEV